MASKTRSAEAQMLDAIESNDIKKANVLLEKKIDANGKNASGATWTELTVEKGTPIMLLLLFEHGADPLAFTSENASLYLKACNLNKDRIAKVILGRMSRNAYPERYKILLHRAVEQLRSHGMKEGAAIFREMQKKHEIRSRNLTQINKPT
jgi:hypothetical protein